MHKSCQSILSVPGGPGKERYLVLYYYVTMVGYTTSDPAPADEWPESDDLGIGGAFLQSAAFASQLSDGSCRRGDVAVPSRSLPAASTTLMRTRCSCKTTGAASANSMTESIRRIGAIILYHCIFVTVGCVTSIRQGDDQRSMKSTTDKVQKKRKVGYILEKVID